MASSPVTVFEAILISLIGLYFVRITLTYVICRFYYVRDLCPDSSGDYTPEVSVIMSIRGLDENAPDNYLSFCEQEYSHMYETVFCVEDRTDPSIPLIRSVISKCPELDNRLVFSDSGNRTNFGKIKNMIAGLRESKYDVIVFSDSDVYAPKTFLRSSVRCLNNPKIGLVFHPPISRGAEDWKAAMLNMAVNENTMNITVLQFFGMGHGAVGTTMAMRKTVIDEIGGLDQFGRQIADDLSIARAIHKKGYKIHMDTEPARITHRHDSFRVWWEHIVRWLVIIRHYLPILIFAGFVFDMPLLLCIFFLIISEHIFTGVILILGVLFFRMGYLALINMKFVRDKSFRRFFWTIPVMDILRLPISIHACLTRKIIWRGRKIHVNRDGTVTVTHPYVTGKSRKQ
ncbi:MAG: glycosyltransferase [Bacteroidales bacterium]|nr:glycosyltransferase [Bacteroidales bacterium]